MSGEKCKDLTRSEARRMVREMAEYLSVVPGLMTDEPEKVTILREVVQALPEADRNLLYLYASVHSYRKAAAVLGFSHTVLRRHIIRIRAEVLETCQRIAKKRNIEI